jgi:hypothetical protein
MSSCSSFLQSHTISRIICEPTFDHQAWEIGVLAQILSEVENPVLMDSLQSELGNPLFIINLLGWAALLIVVVVYLARDRRVGRRFGSTN